MEPVQDLHVMEMQPLISPNELKRELPLTESVARIVWNTRRDITRILRREDDRLLVIVGPCSIHDTDAALEYAERLAKVNEKLKDRLVILMRTYFEKPRTTIGWRGLLNDPHLDYSFDMLEGLRLARKLLLEINQMGLPAATEMLDPVSPQYIAELVSWTAIGARTTESQTHRALASGLSMPVGFKNGTDGGLQGAVDAMISASHPHSFFGINNEGESCVVRTTGNPDGMVILRGGRTHSNFDEAAIRSAAQKLKDVGMAPAVMVDCSHANSGYNPHKQAEVWRTIMEQRAQTHDVLIGVMVESHLFEGKQSIPDNLADLKYGVSITDACMSWETTEELLHYTYEAGSVPAHR